MMATVAGSSSNGPMCMICTDNLLFAVKPVSVDTVYLSRLEKPDLVIVSENMDADFGQS